MSVTRLPLKRAIDVSVMRDPPVRMVRSLATQYWRRTHMLTVPAKRLDAMAVFDDSIVHCLAALKLHLLHVPEMEADLHAEIEAVGRELQQGAAPVFAHACIEVLKLQLDRASDVSPALWNAHLQAQPGAVFDALRFCFDATAAGHLARAAKQAVGHDHQPLVSLLMRLGISRPAVSDAYAVALTALAATQPGGMAALCLWRCAAQRSDAKALAAVEQGRDADAALVALAFSDGPGVAMAAQKELARSPQSNVALALCAARDSHGLAIALREGRFPGMAWSQQLNAAALVGDGPLLRHLAAHTPWNDDIACRSLADGMALLTGLPSDGVFDQARPASERAQWVDAALAALPTRGPALRLGRARAQVTLEDAAVCVGAPLRHLLYVEHVARMRAALWIEADDLASVQALALTTASVFERAAFQEPAP